MVVILGIEPQALDMFMEAIDMMNDSYLHKQTGKQVIPITDKEFRERVTAIHSTIRRMQWKFENKGLSYSEYIIKLRAKRDKNREI